MEKLRCVMLGKRDRERERGRADNGVKWRQEEEVEGGGG